MSDLTFDELFKLVSSNKATASQKIRFAQLLTESTQEELKAEKENKIEKVIDLIEKLELTKEDIVKAFQKPPVLIFEWNSNKRYEGERGKLPQWATDLKSRLSKDEALKFVVANNEKGKVFVENLYKPKQ